MKWSRYNLLFKSERNGWLLYNSASNGFLQMEEETAEIVKEVMEDPDKVTFEKFPELYFYLRNGNFLVEEGQDDDFLRILKMRRLSENYTGSSLTLTIAPTRACNFACPYCYEGNRTASMMTEETEDAIVEFIRKHKIVNSLFIVWYGGEPLLAFKKIRSLNKKIEALGKRYDSFIVTNGYLLNDEVIKALNELKLAGMQITLDGNQETHDSRRHLIGGGATYEKILANMDRLMASEWQGKLQIRVNVDPSNRGDFADVYRLIEKRYPQHFQKRVFVYPGFVHTEDPHPDTNCFFDSRAKGEFLAELYREYGINPMKAYPDMKISSCTMTRKNAYVIGPDGELYKCWNDVGNPECVTGNVRSFRNWNMPLIAEGMIGASYLEDKKCEECFFFPICDGGCAKMRLLNNRDHGERDVCTYFKNHIRTFLELHYEAKYGKPNQ